MPVGSPPADLARLAAGVVHHPEPAPAPLAFAVAELRRYLARIFGRAPVPAGRVDSPGAWLVLAPAGAPSPPVPADVPAGAEWVVRPADGAVAIAGTSPRAALAAAYALLAAAGCEWAPAEEDEHVPDASEVRRAVGPLEGRPAFARRAYASDLATWHYTMPERFAARLPDDVAFVDWMAKTDATAFLFIRSANDTQWVVPELVPELARRGLAIEGGGHALVELLPRALFATHPEYFPMTPGGARSDLGNACPSCAAALAVVRARAEAARRDISGATDLHLWGLDLFGGGWCACPACAGLSPSDQALVVANAAADGLAGGRLWHLAYHDTLPPPRRVRPGPRVWAEFAPRERCYAHAIDDAACPTNRACREALEGHLALFDGRVDVFEYYGDAILFGGVAVPLVDVIARDLAYYRRAGVGGVSCLVFGRFSLWAYGTNVAAFAAGVVDPARAGAARAAHARRRFGRAAPAMTRYLAALEATMAEVVRYGDVKLPPRDADRARRVHDRLVRALDRMPALRALLVEAAAAGGPAIAAEADLLAYTAATLDNARAWLAARLGEMPPARVEESAASVVAAIARLRTLDVRVTGTWGAYDLELTHQVFASLLGPATE
ncbi:MAG TPA: DUF4838 domain-containing protein [Candidatus Binatia bacterium]|nr:DUF4838 domain-containing protein [Candidatus Binatia bacterium]